MAPAELAAAGFGLAYILLAIREHRACWIAGGVSTCIYAFVFLEAGLPMQAGLQLVYVAMAVWGYLAWGRDAKAGAPVRRGRDESANAFTDRLQAVCFALTDESDALLAGHEATADARPSA